MVYYVLGVQSRLLVARDLAELQCPVPIHFSVLKNFFFRFF